MMKRLNTFLSGFFIISMVLPGMAQGVYFNSNQVQAACAQGKCVSIVQETLIQLQQQGLGDADFNSQLGVLASVLFETARTVNQDTAFQIAMALQLLAQFSTDTTQQESLVWVSQQILNGNGVLFDLEAPFAASPN